MIKELVPQTLTTPGAGDEVLDKDAANSQVIDVIPVRGISQFSSVVEPPDIKDGLLGTSLLGDMNERITGYVNS